MYLLNDRVIIYSDCLLLQRNIDEVETSSVAGQDTVDESHFVTSQVLTETQRDRPDVTLFEIEKIPQATSTPAHFTTSRDENVSIQTHNE